MLENTNFIDIPNKYRMVETINMLYKIFDEMNRYCLEYSIIIHVNIVTRFNKSYIRIHFKASTNIIFTLDSEFFNFIELDIDKTENELTLYVKFKSERQIVTMSNEIYQSWIEDLKSYLKLIQKTLNKICITF